VGENSRWRRDSRVQQWRIMKKYLLIAMIGFVSSSTCLAEDWQPVAATGDVLIWRPLSLASTVAGSAIWLVSLPVTVPSKSQGKVFDTMVKRPFKATFTRPVVDISR